MNQIQQTHAGPMFNLMSNVQSVWFKSINPLDFQLIYCIQFNHWTLIAYNSGAVNPSGCEIMKFEWNRTNIYQSEVVKASVFQFRIYAGNSSWYSKTYNKQIIEMKSIECNVWICQVVIKMMYTLFAFRIKRHGVFQCAYMWPCMSSISFHIP